jgi:hypothetical protein
MTIFRSLARPPRNPSGITEWQQRQIREFAFRFRQPVTDEEREAALEPDTVFQELV